MRIGTAEKLRRDLTVLLGLAVIYLGVAWFVPNSYFQLILTLVPIWAAFGVSWNILSGYGGQLSFRHASFFGIRGFSVGPVPPPLLPPPPPRPAPPLPTCAPPP